jgi:putative phosphoesterase
MKALIISDLHGNDDALGALPESYDELWVLGDLVNYGPEPDAVVDFVQRRATFAIRGNHDHAVGYNKDSRCTPRYAAMAAATQRLSETQLNVPQLRFLQELPVQKEFERDGKKVYCCHAKPTNPLYGYCAADSSDWESEILEIEAEIILVGHTHIPFVRHFGSKTLVNPGSVGQSKTGKPDACYAVWQDGKVELKSYRYPYETTIKKIEAQPLGSEIKLDLITVLKTGSV